MAGIGAHPRSPDRGSKVPLPWLGPHRDLVIRRCRQANVAGKFNFVSKIRNERNDRARHICVNQKAHVVLSGGKWVKRLLLGKLADESERRSNIINGQIVLALNFFKCHPAGEAPNHDRHRNTRPTNDGLTVTNSRIDNDAVMSLHDGSNLTGFAQLVEISISAGGRFHTSFGRP